MPPREPSSASSASLPLPLTSFADRRRSSLSSSAPTSTSADNLRSPLLSASSSASSSTATAIAAATAAVIVSSSPSPSSLAGASASGAVNIVHNISASSSLSSSPSPSSSSSFQSGVAVVSGSSSPGRHSSSSSDVSWRYLLATETEQEKTNWVQEILKLRDITGIIELLGHDSLDFYAAFALANISAGRKVEKKRKIVQQGGHVKLLAFLLNSTDQQINSAILYAFSQLATVEENKDEIARTNLPALRTLFCDEQTPIFVKDSIVPTFAYCSSTILGRKFIRGLRLLPMLCQQLTEKAAAATSVKYQKYALLTLANCAKNRACAKEIAPYVQEFLHFVANDKASKEDADQLAEYTFLLLANCCSHKLSSSTAASSSRASSSSSNVAALHLRLAAEIQQYLSTWLLSATHASENMKAHIVHLCSVLSYQEVVRKGIQSDKEVHRCLFASLHSQNRDRVYYALVLLHVLVDSEEFCEQHFFAKTKPEDGAEEATASSSSVLRTPREARRQLPKWETLLSFLSHEDQRIRRQAVSLLSLLCQTSSTKVSSLLSRDRNSLHLVLHLFQQALSLHFIQDLEEHEDAGEEEQSSSKSSGKVKEVNLDGRLSEESLKTTAESAAKSVLSLNLQTAAHCLAIFAICSSSSKGRAVRMEMCRNLMDKHITPTLFLEPVVGTTEQQQPQRKRRSSPQTEAAATTMFRVGEEGLRWLQQRIEQRLKMGYTEDSNEEDCAAEADCEEQFFCEEATEEEGAAMTDGRRDEDRDELSEAEEDEEEEDPLLMKRKDDWDMEGARKKMEELEKEETRFLSAIQIIAAMLRCTPSSPSSSSSSSSSLEKKATSSKKKKKRRKGSSPQREEKGSSLIDVSTDVDSVATLNSILTILRNCSAHGHGKVIMGKYELLQPLIPIVENSSSHPLSVTLATEIIANCTAEELNRRWLTKAQQPPIVKTLVSLLATNKESPLVPEMAKAHLARAIANLSTLENNALQEAGVIQVLVDALQQLPSSIQPESQSQSGSNAKPDVSEQQRSLRSLPLLHNVAWALSNCSASDEMMEELLQADAQITEHTKQEGGVLLAIEKALQMVLQMDRKYASPLTTATITFLLQTATNCLALPYVSTKEETTASERTVLFHAPAPPSKASIATPQSTTAATATTTSTAAPSASKRRQFHLPKQLVQRLVSLLRNNEEEEKKEKESNLNLQQKQRVTHQALCALAYCDQTEGLQQVILRCPANGLDSLLSLIATCENERSKELAAQILDNCLRSPRNKELCAGNTEAATKLFDLVTDGQNPVVLSHLLRIIEGSFFAPNSPNNIKRESNILTPSSISIPVPSSSPPPSSFRGASSPVAVGRAHHHANANNNNDNNNLNSNNTNKNVFRDLCATEEGMRQILSLLNSKQSDDIKRSAASILVHSAVDDKGEIPINHAGVLLALAALFQNPLTNTRRNGRWAFKMKRGGTGAGGGRVLGTGGGFSLELHVTGAQPALAFDFESETSLVEQTARAVACSQYKDLDSFPTPSHDTSDHSSNCSSSSAPSSAIAASSTFANSAVTTSLLHPPPSPRFLGGTPPRPSVSPLSTSPSLSSSPSSSFSSVPPQPLLSPRSSASSFSAPSSSSFPPSSSSSSSSFFAPSVASGLSPPPLPPFPLFLRHLKEEENRFNHSLQQSSNTNNTNNAPPSQQSARNRLLQLYDVAELARTDILKFKSFTPSLFASHALSIDEDEAAEEDEEHVVKGENEAGKKKKPKKGPTPEASFVKRKKELRRTKCFSSDSFVINETGTVLRDLSDPSGASISLVQSDPSSSTTSFVSLGQGDTSSSSPLQHGATTSRSKKEKDKKHASKNNLSSTSSSSSSSTSSDTPKRKSGKKSTTSGPNSFSDKTSSSSAFVSGSLSSSPSSSGHMASVTFAFDNLDSTTRQGVKALSSSSASSSSSSASSSTSSSTGHLRSKSISYHEKNYEAIAPASSSSTSKNNSNNDKSHDKHVSIKASNSKPRAHSLSLSGSYSISPTSRSSDSVRSHTISTPSNEREREREKGERDKGEKGERGEEESSANPSKEKTSSGGLNRQSSWSSLMKFSVLKLKKSDPQQQQNTADSDHSNRSSFETSPSSPSSSSSNTAAVVPSNKDVSNNKDNDGSKKASNKEKRESKQQHQHQHDSISGITPTKKEREKDKEKEKEKDKDKDKDKTERRGSMRSLQHSGDVLTREGSNSSSNKKEAPATPRSKEAAALHHHGNDALDVRKISSSSSSTSSGVGVQRKRPKHISTKSGSAIYSRPPSSVSSPSAASAFISSNINSSKANAIPPVKKIDVQGLQKSSNKALDEQQEGTPRTMARAIKFCERQVAALLHYRSIGSAQFKTYHASIYTYLMEGITKHWEALEENAQSFNNKEDDQRKAEAEEEAEFRGGELQVMPRCWEQLDDLAAASLMASEDRMMVAYWQRLNGHTGAILSDHPFDRSTSWPYFEILILNKGVHGSISIGLAPKDHPRNSHPGLVKGSYGWCGDGKRYEHGTPVDWQDQSQEPTSSSVTAAGSSFCCWESGDVVGCGYNNLTHQIFYTKNGVLMGVGHMEVASGLHPCVGLSGPREIVYANFGQAPFLWDFDFSQQVWSMRPSGPLSARRLVAVLHEREAQARRFVLQDYLEWCILNFDGLAWLFLSSAK
ncbi:Ran-binding protein 10 [Balamuthia mandrillaris]